MLRFAVLALFVAAASATAIAPTTSITRAKDIFGSASPSGVVEGVVPCGGRGALLQTRVTGCTITPCDLHTGSTYFIELDFIPIADHAELNFLVTLIDGEGEKEVVNQPVHTAVKAGSKYTAAYPLTITGSFAQGSVAVKVQLENNGIVEVCGFATAIIHQ